MQDGRPRRGMVPRRMAARRRKVRGIADFQDGSLVLDFNGNGAIKDEKKLFPFVANGFNPLARLHLGDDAVQNTSRK